MPLPVLAETVSSGTSLSCDKPFGERGLDAVEQRRGMLGDVPFVERDDQRAAFLDHLVGDPAGPATSSPRVASSSSTTTSA